MMELRIQLVPTGEIILPPGKNGENYCPNCSKVGKQCWLGYPPVLGVLGSWATDCPSLISVVVTPSEI